MTTKNSRKMLLALLCAALSGTIAWGVEASVSEAVEVATTCEIHWSIGTESPDEHTFETGECGWQPRKKEAGRSPVSFRSEQSPKPSEQLHHNGFGGPLCC